jgi:hypothetical protein
MKNIMKMGLLIVAQCNIIMLHATSARGERQTVGGRQTTATAQQRGQAGVPGAMVHQRAPLRTERIAEIKESVPRRSIPDRPAVVKITPPIPGRVYTIKQLRNSMRVINPQADFLVLVDKNERMYTSNQYGVSKVTAATKVHSVSISKARTVDGKRISLESIAAANIGFTIHQDPRHINVLLRANRLGAHNKEQYQKILLYILVQIENRYYKLYINEPWPGVGRPTPTGETFYPADQIIARHNV